MPVQFISEAEHKSLNRFPSEVSSEDLNRFFLLSDQELSIIKQLRAEHNRLGFALHGWFADFCHELGIKGWMRKEIMKSGVDGSRVVAVR